MEDKREKIIEATNHLMARLQEETGMPEAMCMPFIMMCHAFDVRAIDLSRLSDKQRKAVEIILNDKEFNDAMGKGEQTDADS